MRTTERLKQPGGWRFVPLAVAICTTLPAHAAGTVFSAVLGGSGEDYATALTSDAQGNTYVVGLAYSPDFPVTPGAYQTTIGHLYYPDAFVAKISPAATVIWATYLGGLIDDYATSVALDSAGNVWVSGATRSANFPVVNPIQSTLDNNGGASDNYNTFLAELSPDGSQLLFSTFLGGNNINTPAAMVLDSADNIYLAINTNSTSGFQGIQNGASTSGIVVTKLSAKATLAYSFFHPNDTAEAMAVDSSGAVYVAGTAAGATGFGQQAVVFKISPDGSTKLYEKTFGGSYLAIASAIAVNSAGEVWVAGSTQSADFPLVHPLANQTTLGARPIWESTNGGAAWAPIDNLPFALPKVMLADPSTPTTLYEATGDLGVFKSVNAGATWTQSSTGIGATGVQALAIDPVQPQILYAATATTVFKSTNGAASWSAIDTPPFPVNQILIDGQNDNIVYESNAAIRKSTDGGNTWSSVKFPAPQVATLAVDPHASGHLFAVSQWLFCGFACTNNNYQNPYVYTSTDGGNTWTQLPSPPSSSGLLVDSSTNPSTVYDGLSYKSADGGVTWTALPTPPFSTNIGALAVDPGGNLYAGVYASPIYVSHDGGRSWTALGSPTPMGTTSGGLDPSVISIVPAGSTGALYTTVNTVGTSAFVTKLSADGSTLEYSTYLRGHTEFEPSILYAAEPATMLFQNWIDGIALDASGNVILAGGTRARDFPTARPVQSANAGGSDAFAAMISADGSTLTLSTYFGGSRDDGALAAALDPSGNVILVGQTWSNDFPVTGAPPAHSGLGDAFVVKLTNFSPAVTSVVNGASYQPGIEAGSWAMITGNNLANSTRAWRDSDFSGNNLPTSLDGVSVTIDGKPAFVEYISPTQINVQVPSDSAVGSVNVVVNNNGAVSASFALALQPAAPAFFMNANGTVVATDLDDNPITSSSPAAPGQTVVLWGTGFGATIPAAPAGVLVSGAPATSALPTVTVGGIGAQVIGAVLATGEAGLYQVTIQIPANAPSGQVAIQASIDGLQTQPGVTIAISP